MSAPEPSGAWTTTTVRARPLMMRLRPGKWYGRGGSPGGYSLRMQPPLSRILRPIGALLAG